MTRTRRLLSACGLAVLVGTVAPVDRVGFADDFGYELALERRAAGTYYLNATLTGKTITPLLVDTGSTYVVLTRATFRKLQGTVTAVHVRDIEAEMASGKRVTVPIHRLDELPIADECVLRDVEVAVVPGATRDILGLSALSRIEPFAMSMNPPTLRFSQCAAPGSRGTLPESFAGADQVIAEAKPGDLYDSK